LSREQLVSDQAASTDPRDERPAPRQLHRQQRRAWIAIAALFLSNGFTLATWISRIPVITGTLDLSPGQIGAVLMTLAAGAIVAFPLAGRLIDTRSSAAATILFNLVMIVALPFIGLAPSLPLLMAALFVFGFGNGGMDVSMNAQGIEVERAIGGSIINSLHGFFSLGAFAGAAVGAAAAQVGIAP
jgi:predicted MFS family arabinose efflux permease